LEDAESEAGSCAELALTELLPFGIDRKAAIELLTPTSAGAAVMEPLALYKFCVPSVADDIVARFAIGWGYDEVNKSEELILANCCLRWDGESACQGSETPCQVQEQTEFQRWETHEVKPAVRKAG